MKPIIIALATSIALAGCGDNGSQASGDDDMPPPPPPDITQELHDKISNIVVIYAENRGFDNIYGMFPGANGIPGVSATSKGTLAAQVDRDASLLAKLPQSWGGVTSAGFTPVITQAMSDNLPNQPYALSATYTGFDDTTITRDLVHRFFENQMQIDGGANDQFTAYSDAGGLVMGYFDGSQMAMWDVASHYVLA
ncbi:MAG TPA: alkaline phosphatase family protein, partial [Kofleriaceae bacterium]|nr:alkaline phosphatase family protein [Kofleriaceae bacterium]